MAALSADEDRVPDAIDYGLIVAGTKADDTGGTPLEGATICLTDGGDASATGLTRDNSTCTLPLDDFTRAPPLAGSFGAGIYITAPGKDVTLVLKGTNA